MVEVEYRKISDFIGVVIVGFLFPAYIRYNVHFIALTPHTVLTEVPIFNTYAPLESNNTQLTIKYKYQFIHQVPYEARKPA